MENSNLPKLSWSYSRHRIFQECRRAYYYHYYLSWRGWEENAPEERKKAYILKNMKNIDAWIGDIIHQLIKNILENFLQGNFIPQDKAIQQAKQLIKQGWEQSLTKRWQNSAKYNLNLFEHYYRKDFQQQTITSKLKKISLSLRNFYNSGILDFLTNAMGECYVKIEKLDSFLVNGTEVFAVPDFVVYTQDKYFIYDWKTGKHNPEDKMQLSCYMLYAMDKWKAEEDKIELFPVYLTENNFSMISFQPEPASKVKQFIEISINQMKQIHSLAGNEKLLYEKCWPKENLNSCFRCSFKELCSEFSNKNIS